MKKRWYLIATVVVIAVILVALFKWKESDNVEINSSAYMYTEKGDISKRVDTELIGSFNLKNYNFRGELKIDGIHFTNVLFSSGMGITSFEGNEGDLLGQIYYIHKQKKYIIEITNKELYKKLTGKNYNNFPLIISSPSNTIDEAKQNYSDIKERRDH